MNSGNALSTNCDKLEVSGCFSFLWDTASLADPVGPHVIII